MKFNALEHKGEILFNIRQIACELGYSAITAFVGRYSNVLVCGEYTNYEGLIEIKARARGYDWVTVLREAAETKRDFENRFLGLIVMSNKEKLLKEELDAMRAMFTDREKKILELEQKNNKMIQAYNELKIYALDAIARCQKEKECDKPHKIFGEILVKNFSRCELRTSRNALALKLHPDKRLDKSDVEFKRMDDAYKQLIELV